MVFYHPPSLPNSKDSCKRDLNWRLERPPDCGDTLRVRRAEHPQPEVFTVIRPTSVRQRSGLAQSLHCSRLG